MNHKSAQGRNEIVKVARCYQQSETKYDAVTPMPVRKRRSMKAKIQKFVNVQRILQILSFMQIFGDLSLKVFIHFFEKYDRTANDK
jgi:hypothetical protein